MKKFILTLGAVSGAMAVPLPAAAAIAISTATTSGWLGSIPLTTNGVSLIPADSTPAIWTASYSFNLATTAGASMNVTAWGVDDKAVIELNGQKIAAYLIFNGSGDGTFNYGAGEVPMSFTSFSPFTVSSGFLTGVNTLRVIVNNTGTSDPGTPVSSDGGPTAFEFEALVNAGAVPEPSTWALFILGFGAVGVAARQKRRAPSIMGVSA